MIVAGTLLEVTDTLCEVTIPPAVAVKVTGFGVAIRPVVPPLPTLRFTWKFTCPTVVVTVTVPE